MAGPITSRSLAEAHVKDSWLLMTYNSDPHSDN